MRSIQQPRLPPSRTAPRRTAPARTAPRCAGARGGRVRAAPAAPEARDARRPTLQTYLNSAARSSEMWGCGAPDSLSDYPAGRRARVETNTRGAGPRFPCGAAPRVCRHSIIRGATPLLVAVRRIGRLRLLRLAFGL